MLSSKFFCAVLGLCVRAVVPVGRKVYAVFKATARFCVAKLRFVSGKIKENVVFFCISRAFQPKLSPLLAKKTLLLSLELFKHNSFIMIDIFIIVLLLWAAYNGWRAGFLKEVVSAVGFLVGLLVAATCYTSFGEYLAVNGSETNMFTSLMAFFILWIIVPIVLGFVANVLTRALKGMQLGMPNSMLGAAVSIVKYLVLMSCVLNVMEGLHIMNNEKKGESYLYEPVVGVLQLVFPADTTQVAPADEFPVKNDTVWVNMRRNQEIDTDQYR